MLGASRPERCWLGASLKKYSEYSEKQQRREEKRTNGERWIENVKQWKVRVHIQASDEEIRGAGDHGPAAGVDGVLVPALEHAMGVLEQVLDHNQSLHCQSTNQSINQHTPKCKKRTEETRERKG